MRECKICGAEFQENNGTHLYCSAACRTEAHRRSCAAYQRTKKGEKPSSFRIVCKNCGKVFTGESQRLCYCSPECRIEASRNRSKAYWGKRKEELLHDHVCLLCGKRFSTMSRTAKFCPECREPTTPRQRAEAKRKKEARFQAKIREAMEKHISYGQLQVIAAREAAEAAREVNK